MIADGASLAQAIIDGHIAAYRTGPDGLEKRLNVGELKIGPNSIDVSLGDHILSPRVETLLDPRDPASISYDNAATVDTPNGRAYMIFPQVVYLGFAAERFSIQSDAPGRIRNLVQMLDGRSTVGRIGIAVHVTAGFGDVGFYGNFTLEIVNLGRIPVLLYPGMRIGQIAFHEVWGSAGNQMQYSGAYKNNHIGRSVPPVLGPDRF